MRAVCAWMTRPQSFSGGSSVGRAGRFVGARFDLTFARGCAFLGPSELLMRATLRVANTLVSKGIITNESFQFCSYGD